MKQHIKSYIQRNFLLILSGLLFAMFLIVSCQEDIEVVDLAGKMKIKTRTLTKSDEVYIRDTLRYYIGVESEMISHEINYYLSYKVPAARPFDIFLVKGREKEKLSPEQEYNITRLLKEGGGEEGKFYTAEFAIEFVPKFAGKDAEIDFVFRNTSLDETITNYTLKFPSVKHIPYELEISKQGEETAYYEDLYKLSLDMTERGQKEQQEYYIIRITTDNELGDFYRKWEVNEQGQVKESTQKIKRVGIVFAVNEAARGKSQAEASERGAEYYEELGNSENELTHFYYQPKKKLAGNAPHKLMIKARNEDGNSIEKELSIKVVDRVFTVESEVEKEHLNIGEEIEVTYQLIGGEEGGTYLLEFSNHEGFEVRRTKGGERLTGAAILTHKTDAKHIFYIKGIKAGTKNITATIKDKSGFTQTHQTKVTAAAVTFSHTFSADITAILKDKEYYLTFASTKAEDKSEYKQSVSYNIDSITIYKKNDKGEKESIQPKTLYQVSKTEKWYFVAKKAGAIRVSVYREDENGLNGRTAITFEAKEDFAVSPKMDKENINTGDTSSFTIVLDGGVLSRFYKVKFSPTKHIKVLGINKKPLTDKEYFQHTEGGTYRYYITSDKETSEKVSFCVQDDKNDIERCSETPTINFGAVKFTYGFSSDPKTILERVEYYIDFKAVSTGDRKTGYKQSVTYDTDKISLYKKDAKDKGGATQTTLQSGTKYSIAASEKWYFTPKKAGAIGIQVYREDDLGIHSSQAIDFTALPNYNTVSREFYRVIDEKGSAFPNNQTRGSVVFKNNDPKQGVQSFIPPQGGGSPLAGKVTYTGKYQSELDYTAKGKAHANKYASISYGNRAIDIDKATAIHPKTGEQLKTPQTKGSYQLSGDKLILSHSSGDSVVAVTETFTIPNNIVYSDINGSSADKEVALWKDYFAQAEANKKGSVLYGNTSYTITKRKITCTNPVDYNITIPANIHYSKESRARATLDLKTDQDITTYIDKQTEKYATCLVPNRKQEKRVQRKQGVLKGSIIPNNRGNFTVTVNATDPPVNPLTTSPGDPAIGDFYIYVVPAQKYFKVTQAEADAAAAKDIADSTQLYADKHGKLLYGNAAYTWHITTSGACSNGKIPYTYIIPANIVYAETRAQANAKIQAEIVNKSGVKDQLVKYLHYVDIYKAKGTDTPDGCYKVGSIDLEKRLRRNIDTKGVRLANTKEGSYNLDLSQTSASDPLTSSSGDNTLGGWYTYTVPKNKHKHPTQKEAEAAAQKDLADNAQSEANKSGKVLYANTSFSWKKIETSGDCTGYGKVQFTYDIPAGITYAESAIAANAKVQSEIVNKSGAENKFARYLHKKAIAATRGKETEDGCYKLPTANHTAQATRNNLGGSNGHGTSGSLAWSDSRHRYEETQGTDYIAGAAYTLAVTTSEIKTKAEFSGIKGVTVKEANDNLKAFVQAHAQKYANLRGERLPGNPSFKVDVSSYFNTHKVAIANELENQNDLKFTGTYQGKKHSGTKLEFEMTGIHNNSSKEVVVKANLAHGKTAAEAQAKAKKIIIDNVRKYLKANAELKVIASLPTTGSGTYKCNELGSLENYEFWVANAYNYTYTVPATELKEIKSKRIYTENGIGKAPKDYHSYSNPIASYIGSLGLTNEQTYKTAAANTAKGNCKVKVSNIGNYLSKYRRTSHTKQCSKLEKGYQLYQNKNYAMIYQMPAINSFTNTYTYASKSGIKTDLDNAYNRKISDINALAINDANCTRSLYVATNAPSKSTTRKTFTGTTKDCNKSKTYNINDSHRTSPTSQKDANNLWSRFNTDNQKLTEDLGSAYYTNRYSVTKSYSISKNETLKCPWNSNTTTVYIGATEYSTTNPGESKSCVSGLDADNKAKLLATERAKKKAQSAYNKKLKDQITYYDNSCKGGSGEDGE